MVEVFQDILIEKGLISKELGKQAYDAHFEEVPNVQKEFEQQYRGKEEEFKKALLDARDYFGKLMAGAWSKTSAEGLRYWKVMKNMMDIDQQLSGGKYKQAIQSCFDWREIKEDAIDRPFLKTHIVDELAAISNVGNAGTSEFLQK